MRKFIAIAIFAIGMFTMLPYPSSGSSSPTDQVCFVIDSHQAVPAIDVQAINVETLVSYELQANQLVCVAENVVQKSPDFNKFYRLNYRTCYTNSCVRSQDKLLTKNKKHSGPERIRDDTSLE